MHTFFGSLSQSQAALAALALFNALVFSLIAGLWVAAARGYRAPRHDRGGEPHQPPLS